MESPITEKKLDSFLNYHVEFVIFSTKNQEKLL